MNLNSGEENIFGTLLVCHFGADADGDSGSEALLIVAVVFDLFGASGTY